MTTKRKGRPVKKAADKVSRHVSALVHEATYKKLEKLAQRNGRTVSGQIRVLVEDGVKGVR